MNKQVLRILEIKKDKKREKERERERKREKDRNERLAILGGGHYGITWN